MPATNPRHETFVERAKAGGLRIVFLGDSITDYWKDYAIWEQKVLPLGGVADFGIGGDTAGGVLDRVERGTLRGSGARTVVLLIGTNDLGAGTSPETVCRSVDQVCQAIHSELPEARVLLLGILPRADEKPVAQTNAMLAKLPGVTFVDTTQGWQADFLVDGIHLNRKGYDWLTALVLPYLNGR